LGAGCGDFAELSGDGAGLVGAGVGALRWDVEKKGRKQFFFEKKELLPYSGMQKR